MTHEESIKKYRDFTQRVDSSPPQDDEYRVMASWPNHPTKPVSEPIQGRYHALYVRDRLADEHGYMGVSFHIEEVSDS